MLLYIPFSEVNTSFPQLPQGRVLEVSQLLDIGVIISFADTFSLQTRDDVIQGICVSKDPLLGDLELGERLAGPQSV